MNSSVQTKRMAFSAILTGISVVFILGAVFLPSGRIASLALSGVPILYLDLALGRRYSLLAFLAAGLLSLLCGSLAVTAAYTLFFGCYPIVKDHLQAFFHKKKKTQLLLKFLFFYGMMLLLGVLALKFFILMPLSAFTPLNIAAAILGGGIVFYLYDRALGRVGAMLFFRLRKYTDQLL